MAAKDTAKDLAVYVIGISGKCSKNYTGCGKSCLCRQYMYNEYIEESYSTLLQSEFDGCVINQQHVIYWGKKEETYKEMTKGQCSFVAKVNFEVFEHTIFYQDGTNQPFHGYDKYENRVFTHLRSFLGKYAFKSRDEVLNPEDYGSKKFSYSRIVPVAYLYVVDVSQSCCVFEEQMQLMSTLVKSIHKKKQSCVVVASKFDTHCRANMERLESLASKLKVLVIQCSTKYNTNVDTAFKYLAVKALSLKKLSVNVLTYAEVTVQKRVAISTKAEQDDTNIDIIPHISMANKLLSMSQDPSEDYDVPPDSLRGMSQDLTEDYDVPPDSQRENIYIPTDDSDDSFISDDELKEDGDIPSNQEVVHDSEDTLSANANIMRPESEECNEMYRRSTMPLQRTSLKNILSRLEISDSSVVPQPANSGSNSVQELKYTFDSSSVNSSSDSKGRFSSRRLTFPLPRAPLQSSLLASSSAAADSQVTDDDEDIHDYEQMDELSSSSDGYEKIDYGLPDVQNLQEDSLPSTHATSYNATQKDTQEHVQCDEPSTESEGYVIDQIDFGHPVTEKMQSTHHEVTGASNATVKANDEEYYEWCEVKLLRKPLPVASAAATPKSDASVQYSSSHKTRNSHEKNTTASQSVYNGDNTVALTGENLYDDTKSPTTEIKRLELRHTNSTTSYYVRMYKANNPSSKRDSDIYTYDYVDHSFVQMCKRRKRCTGVPPRNIKRIGYEPSIYINMDAIKEHETYANFRAIESHTIPLPPRENRKRPIPKRRANYKPPMHPRNIPRPGCFLSAPSAVPKTT